MKRFLPLLAFVTIALVGTIGAAFVWSADQRNKEIRFAAVAEEAANRVAERIGRHMLVIEATSAMFEAKSGWITRAAFQTYFRNLHLPERNPGGVGLGYSVFAQRSERDDLARAYEASNGEPLDIRPPPGDDFVAVAVMFESSEPGPNRTSGFDAYSDPLRRQAIDQAIADQQPRATGPLVLLRDGTDPQLSFNIYAPVYSATFGIPRRAGPPPMPTGFVVGSFHGAELLESALDVAPFLPLNVSVADVAASEAPLFTYGAAPSPRFGAGFTARHPVDVAGRQWDLTIRPTDDFRPPSTGPLALALGAVSLLLAAAAAAMLREQSRAHDTAEALAATTQRNLAEKDLILQEMKHRIKNAIARILAIARQTAAGADSLEAFHQTFSQRLQAMSTAQDMLTRSKWQRADLGELLTRELTQIFGPEFDAHKLRGPAVELDERTTQALGLTFHELATNALKYGTAGSNGPRIDVTWTVTRRDGRDWLGITWVESGGEGVTSPAATGFGTRLIDANVRHELGGTVDRDYRPTGLSLSLRVPLPSAPPLRAN